MKRALDGLFLFALGAYVVTGALVTPFHGDESTQIYMSRDFAYLFLLGQPERVRYSEPPLNATEQHLRLLNGVVNKYAIGAAWALAGFAPDELNEQWDWGADWSYNHTNGHAPSADLLRVSRWPSAQFLVVGLLAVFALAEKTGGRAAAWIAALLYALHPALLLNGRRAMMEGSLIAFTALAALTAMYWLERRGRQAWGWATVFGLCAGLAVASKHTAALAIVPIGLGALGFALYRGRSEGARKAGARIGQMALAGLIAALVFLALNPAWWSDPFGRAADVLRLRSELLDGQTAAFGGFAGLPDAFAGFARQAFAPVPQYFEVAGWGEWLAPQITAYEASGLAGVTAAWLWALAALILGGAGFVALLRGPGRTEARWIVGLWLLSALAAALLLTPIEWQRYYLPVYPPLMAVMGVGGAWLGQGFFAKARTTDHAKDAKDI
ncbi:MAG: phospholipid carrier-dependent glycosyltransferase [Anaerolineae bacterium]|nr:phospholipid carrier-dependent glycosyltransferase [Anaerolineae bacterium]